MGCCILFRNSSSSSSGIINNVRVVDLTGYVEEFDYPVTASQVTERPQKHFLFTAAELLSISSLKPLDPEAILEPGSIYFLLPSSAFGHEVSPLDLASLVKKLTAKAKSDGNKKPLLRSRNSPLQCCPSSSSPLWSTNNSPLPLDKLEFSRVINNNAAATASVDNLSPGKRIWRPILDTIAEASFRKSHSDLPKVN